MSLPLWLCLRTRRVGASGVIPSSSISKCQPHRRKAKQQRKALFLSALKRRFKKGEISSSSSSSSWVSSHLFSNLLQKWDLKHVSKNRSFNLHLTSFSTPTKKSNMVLKPTQSFQLCLRFLAPPSLMSFKNCLSHLHGCDDYTIHSKVVRDWLGDWREDIQSITEWYGSQLLLNAIKLCSLLADTRRASFEINRSEWLKREKEAVHFIVHEVVEYKLVRTLNYWSQGARGSFNKFKGCYIYEPRTTTERMANGVLVPVVSPRASGPSVISSRDISGQDCHFQGPRHHWWQRWIWHVREPNEHQLQQQRGWHHKHALLSILIGDDQI